MSLTNCRVLALAVFGSACLLAACDDAPPAQAEVAPGQPKPAAPPKAQISNDMVAAVSAGKTATALGVHFALGSPPTVGKALPVEIAIVPHREFSVVRAHFEGPDGLAVTAGENFGPSTDAESEKSLKHQLVLLPAREGVFMLTASVETDSNEGNVTRVFSIPVIVSPSLGSATAPAAAETASSPPGKPQAN